MRHQVVVIHGGNSFKTHREAVSFLKRRPLDFSRYLVPTMNWKGTLGTALGKRYVVIQPDMPNKQNAKYAEWKIWFEKFIPHFNKEVSLVGHSLGGLFLAKYLSENVLPKKILGTFLVAAAPFGRGGFLRPKSLKRLEHRGGKIFLYQSVDDPLVKFTDFEKYEKMLPGATARVFKNRGHFNQPGFPELVRDIRSLY